MILFLAALFCCVVNTADAGTCAAPRFRPSEPATPMPASLTGELSAERAASREGFKVLKLLNKGGFGQVWLVQDQRSGQNYAMKQVASDRFHRESVQREIQGLTGLAGHPGVVHLERHFEDDQFFYLVLELLKQDLTDYTVQKYAHQGLPLAVIRSVVKDVLPVLATMHSKGLVHRDIKPENLMISSEVPFKIKVIDFGAMAKAGATGLKVEGTYSYMAPEVLLGYAPSPAGDLWSFGVALSELALGKAILHRKFGGDPLERCFKQVILIQQVVGPVPKPLILNPMATVLSGPNRAFELLRVAPEGGNQLFNHLSFLSQTSQGAKLLDLIQKLLNMDPRARISAEEALHQPFVFEEDDSVQQVVRDDAA